MAQRFKSLNSLIHRPTGLDGEVIGESVSNRQAVVINSTAGPKSVS